MLRSASGLLAVVLALAGCGHAPPPDPQTPALPRWTDGWQPFVLPGKTKTVYTQQRLDDRWVLHAMADRSASMIVIESGPAHLGQWRNYVRNIRADYLRAFGEEPGALIGVARRRQYPGPSEAWYGDAEPSVAFIALHAVPVVVGDPVSCPGLRGDAVGRRTPPVASSAPGRHGGTAHAARRTGPGPALSGAVRALRRQRMQGDFG
jgi:hypothetical protein